VSFETALYNRLSSQLSTTVGTRIYPGIAPQNTTTPYIVYLKVSAGKEYSHGGSVGLSRDRVQVGVFSTGYLTAKSVVSKVVTAMEGSTVFQASFKANELDIYESETKMFHVPVDFFVWHNL
jgi:hypothetical protein